MIKFQYLFIFFLGKVVITALPQIETKGMKMDQLEELMERVRSAMLATYHETSKEVTHGLHSIPEQKIT